MRVVLPQTNQRRGDQSPEGAPLHRPLRQAEIDRPAAPSGGENLLNFVSLCDVASMFPFVFTFCFLYFFCFVFLLHISFFILTHLVSSVL